MHFFKNLQNLQNNIKKILYLKLKITFTIFFFSINLICLVIKKVFLLIYNFNLSFDLKN